MCVTAARGRPRGDIVDMRPDYIQHLLLMCKHPGDALLEGLRCTGVIRSYVSFEVGSRAVLAMAPAPPPPPPGDADATATTTRSEPICPPEDNSLICTLLRDVPIINRLSFSEPLADVGFLAVKVAGGSKADYTSMLAADTSTGDDFYFAASRVYGSADIDFILEIMGNDRGDVFRKIEELTDLPFVVSSDVHLAARHHTRGFGTQPD